MTSVDFSNEVHIPHNHLSTIARDTANHRFHPAILGARIGGSGGPCSTCYSNPNRSVGGFRTKKDCRTSQVWRIVAHESSEART